MKYSALIGKFSLVALASWFFACEDLIIPDTAEMEIVTPTTGDSWQVGADSAAIITWTQVDAFGPIKLELYLDREYYSNIATGARVVDLEYIWTVPGSVEPGRGFKVYIESEWDTTLNTMSNAFDIDPYQTTSELTVTAPASSDAWQIGVQNNAAIRWTYADLTGAVTIVLFDGVLPVATIADSVALADTAFYWTVPQSIVDGSDYRIYLESHTNEYIGTYGEIFDILPSATPSSLELTAPVRNATWQVGLINGAVISWNHANLTGTVKLDLLQSGTFVTSITDSIDAQAGTFTWTVPLTVVDGRNYQVYIQSNDLANVNHLSDDFNIDPFDSEPALDVIGPVGGDIWVLGQIDQAVINWAYANVSGTISIDLYTGRSTYITTIADTADISAATFTWTVPDTFATGTQYNVRLASHELPELQSTGPKFEIADLASVAALNVVTPALSDFWIAGQTDGALIEWSSEYLIGTVRIDLIIPGKGNNPDITILVADDVDVTLATYLWTVPDDPALLVDDAFVLITSNEITTIMDPSDEFSIVSLASLVALNITSPIPGDFWVRVILDGGSVSWTSAYLTGTISIDITTTRGQNVTAIRLVDEVDIDLGYLSLTIPSETVPVGTNYSLLLTSNEKPEITSQIGSISILDVADVASLAITLPQPADTWIINQADGAQIEWWASPYTGGTISIELFAGTISKQDIIPFLTIDSLVSVAGGSYAWTVPDSIPTGDYSVRIASDVYPGIEDHMSTVAILDSASVANITITYPAGGEVFTADSTIFIEWTSQFMVGDFSIELHKANALIAVIDTVDVLAGSAPWTVGSGSTGNNHFIRMVRIDESAPEWDSDKFWIK